MKSLKIALHTSLNPILCEQWQTLFSALPAKTLFQHVGWHEAFIASRHREEQHGKVIFAVATIDNQTVAILPLLYRCSEYCRRSARILELMHPTDMRIRDVLLIPEIEIKQIIDSILYEALPTAGYMWDVFELKDVIMNSSAYQIFQQAMGVKYKKYDHDSTRLKSIPGREFCFSHIPKGHLKKMLRKQKALSKLGEVQYEMVADPKNLERAYKVFMAVEDSGWKGSLGQKTSLLHDLPQKAFYANLISARPSELNFCAFILYLDGKPIAAKLCTKTGDTLFMLKISYDDKYADFSPGNILLMYALQHLSDDPQVQYISFVTGGAWTHRWAPERLPVYRCVLFKPTIRGIFLSALEYARHFKRKIRNREPKLHRLRLPLVSQFDIINSN